MDQAEGAAGAVPRFRQTAGIEKMDAAGLRGDGPVGMTENGGAAVVLQCFIIEILLAEVHVFHVAVGHQQAAAFRIDDGIIILIEGTVGVAFDPDGGCAQPLAHVNGILVVIAAVDDQIHLALFL